MGGAIGIRIGLAVVLAAGGWLAQAMLERHVKSAGPLEEVPLARPLVELPLELGDWRGEDRPIREENAEYADAHVQRVYRHRDRRQAVSLWIVYSRDGKDRGHHPEVCMAVAGRPEDASQRAAISVEGHAAPIQQYRFGTTGDRQWVFYWYYTLVPPQAPQMSQLARFYQRLRQRPASVTLEVFAPEAGPDDGAAAQEFVKLVDKAVQEHLGPTAVRGSQRLPVTVIRTKGD